MRDKFEVTLTCDITRLKEVAKDQFDFVPSDETAGRILDLMEENNADEAFDEFIAQEISNFLDTEGDTSETFEDDQD